MNADPSPKNVAAVIRERGGRRSGSDARATHRAILPPPIHTIQELLGHADFGTTMIRTHVSQPGATDVKSRLDQL